MGEPYDDVLIRVAQVSAQRTSRVDFDVPAVDERRPPAGLLGAVVMTAGAVGGALGTASGVGAAPGVLAAAGLTGLAGGAWAWIRWQRSMQSAPDDVLAAIGTAVAEALGQRSQVVVAPDGDGIWRVELDSDQSAESEQFAAAMAQVLAPVDNPRYVISRRLPRHRAEQWHAVPESLGRNKALATTFAQAWSKHVSPSRLLLTRSPEGAGVLAAVQGLRPLDAACALRSEWR